MNNFLFSDLKEVEQKFLRLARDFELEIRLNNSSLLEACKLNPAVARNVVELITIGYSPREAIITTGLKFNWSDDRVRAVYDSNRCERKAQILYAKNYLIHKLKEKGFKMIDIAFVLDCNTQTVRNYLKKDFIP